MKKLKFGKEKSEVVEKCKSKDAEKNVEKRDAYANHLEFVLSCIGFSVGIGNIWRFPYVCYINGGGAFLIPYLLTLVFVGKPLYFMELALGQFTRLGPPGAFNLIPISYGVGISMLLVSSVIGIYYNVLMTYCLYYMIASFNKVLPWSHCNNEWNTPGCFDFSSNNSLNISNMTFRSSSEEFLLLKVFESDKANGIENLGGINTYLCLLLLLSWIIVFLVLYKGIETSGKVIYVSSTLPYLILLILLIRAAFLPGAKEGIKYFFTPTWSKLLSIKVWQAAIGQMFFSLSTSIGGLIAFASFTNFNNNCYRDSLIVTTMDTFTSLLGGSVIFMVLGYMALIKNVPIDSVVDSGPGLAFIVYPEALSQLPVPQLWSFLFFLMLYLLGLDSQIAFIQTIGSAVHDQLKEYCPWRYKTYVNFTICMVLFVLGLPCVTRGGEYVLHMMDFYGSNLTTILIGGCEVVGIMWIYGCKNFVKDIETMLGRKVPHFIFWKVLWVFLVPVVLWGVTILFIYLDLHKSYGFFLDDYMYPRWAVNIGWGLFAIVVIPIPLWAFIMFFMSKGDMKEKFNSILQSRLILEHA